MENVTNGFNLTSLNSFSNFSLYAYGLKETEPKLETSTKYLYVQRSA